MEVRLVHQFPPKPDNPRNSEGAFLRGKQGELLFAYSRYHGDRWRDWAACDIALVESWDEGESWSEERIIVRGAEFGVKNVMSVSALELSDGRLAFYFLIKENDWTSTFGRAVSEDGKQFTAERCRMDCPPAYYILNNDRLVRLSDGRILAPVGVMPRELTEGPFKLDTTCLISEDDGYTFFCADYRFAVDDPYGFQEPGVIEYEDRIWMFIRTNFGSQYTCESTDGGRSFSYPRASQFTSPISPMQVKRVEDAVYAIYNPIPLYNGREYCDGTWGRTPFVLRKSIDDGKTFGKLNVIEDDPTRGYCYPAVTGTKDGCLLVAYCRGNGEDGFCLCTLGIAKIKIDSIEI